MPDEARATLTEFSAEREREGGAVAHELVALDATCNARAVICLMEGDTHIRKIYSKLGARDRSSAVQRARELRLLSTGRYDTSPK
jgi:hypothetical protein